MLKVKNVKQGVISSEVKKYAQEKFEHEVIPTELQLVL